jgi:hAT family C-terminal dimerisation region
VLTADQYEAAKQLAISFMKKFFANSAMLPLFVPLNPNVASRINEIKEEIKQHFEDEKQIDPPRAKKAREEAPPPPAPLAAVAALAPAKPAIPSVIFGIDMDAGIAELKEEKEQKHDIDYEIRAWFGENAPPLQWNQESSKPPLPWKADEKIFPHLAYLARRFLCILPTSAPSERVWSAFGHIVTDQSSSIDSTIAAQTLWLRYNHEYVTKVPV